MSKQTLTYIEDMNKMYEVIMHKCIDNGELTDLDRLFLETYNRTIKTKILSTGCTTVAGINKK